MSKTVAANLAAHVKKEVTSLASCWRVTRVDGTVHRFTEHDRDITFTSNISLGATQVITAGEVYLSVGGYKRTAVSTSSGTRVDNLDLEGLKSTAGITDADLRGGLFDLATVEIFLVNWRVPNDGIIAVRKGTIGEITLKGNVYESELRGQTQKLSRKIVEVTTQSCRAIWGDSRCGVNADDWKESTLTVTVTNNQQFTVPANETLDQDPDLSSGQFSGARFLSPDIILAKGAAEKGTPGNPFLVSTPADLNNIRNNLWGWYVLTNDIDMSGYGTWTPIDLFRGVIDGCGFEIQDLDVDLSGSPQDAGFIDRLRQSGFVRRLGIRRATVRSGGSTDWAAPLVARVQATDQAGNFGGVELCYAVDCDITTDGDRAGGLVGNVRDLEYVRRCFTANRFSGTIGSWVGPVIARVEGSDISEDADCFADDGRGGVGQDGNNVVGTTRLTTAQAQADANYTNFDFDRDEVWVPPSEQVQAAYVDTGSETLTFAEGGGSRDTLTRSAGSWITDGFEEGDRFVVAGTSNNNGTYDIWTVTATVITIHAADDFADEGPIGATGVSITAGKYPRLRTVWF